MIYFTSDLHLGHTNIINHCNRPFKDAQEMDAKLISNWNETVTQDDDVYILGDLSMCQASVVHKYLERLPGRKHLIKGNHDQFLYKHGDYLRMYRADFVWVKDYFVLNANGRRFVLFHYPILEWEGYYRNTIHLYGHVHNGSTEVMQGMSGLAFNVGVDCNGFKPVSIDEIIKKT